MIVGGDRHEPGDEHTSEGRVFWTAVEAELAVRRHRGKWLTVFEVIARATANMSVSRTLVRCTRRRAVDRQDR